MDKQLKVLIVSSEVAPFAKTGGLGDVTGSLPLELEKHGVDVRVMMPKYASVKSEEDVATIGKNIKVYFVRHDDYFKRRELYGDKFGDYNDNLDRFSFFSRAVLDRCKKEGFQPDIINCNDWQTALIPAYLNTLYKYDPFFEKTKTLFTVHNIAYQGLFPKEEYPKLGLDWALFDIRFFEYYGKVNLMKAGFVYADAINTVSPTYAKEIMTPEFGCGLEGVLAERKRDLYGILNGLDYAAWDPSTDTKIAKRYSLETVDDKYANKEALQDALALKVDRDMPLIGMITRLADQKGLDIFAKVVDDLLAMKVQFVLLGTGEHRYHALFEKVAVAHRKNCSVQLKFDPALAQKIYAASDIFLVPSRYEPCGLSQLISYRYGAVPVVRMTGGLKDTVHEFDPATKTGTGFAFTDYRPDALFAAIKKALNVYMNREVWRMLVKRVMALDYSWHASAGEYLALYRKICGMDAPLAAPAAAPGNGATESLKSGPSVSGDSKKEGSV